MTTPENNADLVTALAAAQAEMSNAPLNKTNPHFKNRYADLASIRDATLPHLNKHGLALLQFTQITEAGAILVTRLAHKSGQWVEGVYPLPMQFDKPQIMGSAITYARRYAWAAMCGITADEDDDAEGASKQKTNGNGVHPRAIISPEQVKTLRAAIREVDANEKLLLAYLKAPSIIEEMPAALYQQALEALDSKRAAAATDKKAVRK